MIPQLSPGLTLSQDYMLRGGCIIFSVPVQMYSVQSNFRLNCKCYINNDFVLIIVNLGSPAKNQGILLLAILMLQMKERNPRKLCHTSTYTYNNVSGKKPHSCPSVSAQTPISYFYYCVRLQRYICKKTSSFKFSECV